MNTTPYFYIIKHKQSGKKYAGSKWAKKCNPNTFMTPKGYKTSSSIIKKIIASEGLTAFEIVEINIDCDGLHPYEFETQFLQKHNCAKSPEWFNNHNNDNKISFGTEEFENQMVAKYGVKSSMHLSETKEKIKATTISKYGVNHVLQSTEVREKISKTNLEKYEVNHVLQSTEVREKISKTNLEKYGFTSHNSNEMIKEKKKHIFLEKYNVENPSQLQEVKEKKQQTCNSNFGVDWPSQSTEVKQKIKQAVFEKYGVLHVSQRDEQRKQASERAKEKATCPYCGHVGQKIQMGKKHFDNCANKINYV